ncbi:MAG: peptide chain release factor N(5)-glutamine methyltransferase [Parasphingorhabdus sp.]
MAKNRTQTPPLQGRGKGWGISKARLAILQKRAKAMRLNPTEPEKILWRHLSRSQIGGHKFRRQAVIGEYIADFYCPGRSLIVEVDGDTHDSEKDGIRDRNLMGFGCRTLRFTNEEVMQNMSGVLERISLSLREAVSSQSGLPHPNPSPEGEGLSAANALREAAQRLSDISDTPRLDAELLLAHSLGISREKLLLDLPNLSAPSEFSDLVARREKSEPVAHLIGTKEFWGLEFAVSPNVLIPRPDSELLIEQAVQAFAQNPPENILDLGTGSGALLLAALSEFPKAKGVGIDASAKALGVAHNNADSLKLTDRAQFHLVDWTTLNWVQSLVGRFDLILANPPYVSSKALLSQDVAGFEPHNALFAGADGLDDYKIIIPALTDLLIPNGIVLLEIGFDQQESVSKIALENGYVVECKQDLGENDRLLILTR